MKRMAAVALGLAGLLLSGCFDIEQTLALEKDMSGKAGFSLKMDMEPMVLFMTRMQREMEGKTGDPTPEELAKARQEMLASKSSQSGMTPPDAKEIREKLPQGVTLLDSSFVEDGLKIGANFLFGFDNVSKLREIQLKKDPTEASEAPAGPMPGAGGPNPMDTPFGGLQVVDEGSTLLVTSPAENPLAEQQEQAEQMPLSPEDKAQLEQLFGTLRVAFKITAPFDIVEHNAHRREGDTLVWEYDLDSMQKLKPEQLAQGVRVRYRK